MRHESEQPCLEGLTMEPPHESVELASLHRWPPRIRIRCALRLPASGKWRPRQESPDATWRPEGSVTWHVPKARGDVIAQPEGEDGEINFDDIHDEWFVEAIEKIDLPPPWEKRRVRGSGERMGRMYFLDPRSKRTTWKDPRFLPDGWDQRVDGTSGKVFFQYHRTRQTTYVDPRSCPLGWDMRLSKDGSIYFAFLPAMRTTIIDPRGLPDNFDAALDDLARMYFKNHEAQATTWDDPRSGQQEVTLTKWRQAQSTRWWKEQVWREIEEMNRRKELDDKSELESEAILERGTP
ncbi:unnamed protein product [Effrenium voratum]|nr:unnamed protein product [Effrenium voratum]